MIVREIKKSHNKVLDHFNWSDDYRDTRRWCRTIGRDDLVNKLDRGFMKDRKERYEQQKQQTT